MVSYGIARRGAAVLGLVLALSGMATAAADDESIVHAPAGPVRGVVTPYARQFRGIPFAQPPTGERRFAPPEPMAPWTETRDALMDGPGCPQTCVLPPHGCPPTTSEDCLLLNVFTPRVEASKAMDPGGAPVMAFIHGGNMRQGYAGGILYDGTHLVNTTGVILVVLQYRLGPTGWLASNNTMTPNAGLLDEIAALKWIQTNIAAFGGDPTKVTVFGQSAGAVSGALLLSAPPAEPLFRNAILESEPMGIPYRNTEQQEQWTYDFASHYCNCSGSPGSPSIDKCLRALPISAITTAAAAAMKDLIDNFKDPMELFWPWGPTVGASDGLVPQQPFYSWQQGAIQDKPIIIGSVHDEGTVFVYEALGKPVSRFEYDILLGVLFGVGPAIRIGEAYPVPKAQSDARPTAAVAATDGLFACENRNATIAVAQHNKSPVWLYHFNKVLSFNNLIWGNETAYKKCWYKVCHAGELPEVFHPNASLVGGHYLPDEELLSTAMETYWSNFARNNDPGSAVPGAGLPPLAWPQYGGETGNRKTMALDTPNTVVDDPKAEMCDVWDQTEYTWLNR